MREKGSREGPSSSRQWSGLGKQPSQAMLQSACHVVRLCEQSVAKQDHHHLRISTVQPRLKGLASELWLRRQLGKARGQLGGARDYDAKASYVYRKVEGSQATGCETSSDVLGRMEEPDDFSLLLGLS